MVAIFEQYGSRPFQKCQALNFSTGGSREIAVRKSLHSYLVQKSEKAIFSEKCQKHPFGDVLEQNVTSKTPSEI